MVDVRQSLPPKTHHAAKSPAKLDGVEPLVAVHIEGLEDLSDGSGEL
jgi:hypothetical protein